MLKEILTAFATKLPNHLLGMLSAQGNASFNEEIATTEPKKDKSSGCAFKNLTTIPTNCSVSAVAGLQYKGGSKHETDETKDVCNSSMPDTNPTQKFTEEKFIPGAFLFCIYLIASLQLSRSMLPLTSAISEDAVEAINKDASIMRGVSFFINTSISAQ